MDETKAILKVSITQSGILSMVEEKDTKIGKVVIYRSTSKLDTKEFQTLLDYLFQIMETMGIAPKYPEEVYNSVEMAREIFN